MYDVSHVLRVLRVDKGLSQDELAEALKVSRVTLSLWESGRRSPSKENCEAICEYFGIDMNYLLGFSSVRKSTKQGTEVMVFKEGNTTDTTLYLPDGFLDPKGAYWAEMNSAKTQILIYSRESKSVVTTISKF